MKKKSLLFLSIGLISAVEARPQLKGDVVVDGSSTVFPILEAAAEEFSKTHSGIRVSVATSGTGGGLKRFCRGEVDIANASRPIKDSEIEQCKKSGTRFIEIPLAYDGLTVVVSRKSNPWTKIGTAPCVTTSDLKRVWEPDSKVNDWKEVNGALSSQKLLLFGPGHDSGTFDYFTEVINGKAQAHRKDYTASEDDNVLVRGVSGNGGALGYFGFAYYEANKDKLVSVAVDSGKGCVYPSVATISDGSYAPLSRPLFLYVSAASWKKPQVKEFLNWSYAGALEPLVREVGYIPLSEKAYRVSLERLSKERLGSVYTHARPTSNLEMLFAR